MSHGYIYILRKTYLTTLSINGLKQTKIFIAIIPSIYFRLNFVSMFNLFKDIIMIRVSQTYMMFS